MKKWLLIVIVILGLLLSSAYVFFPKEVKSSNAVKITCSINSINRFLMVENKWPEWWPGTVKYDSISKKNVYDYKGFKYEIAGHQYNAILIKTMGEDFTVDGTIFFLPLKIDSVQAEWKYVLETNSNPINRIHLYWETKKINNNMMDIMNSMKAFLEEPENVYGMRIDRTIVKDTILVTTKFSSDQYPSTSKIYNVISGIKNYIASNKAKETNFPMLHVWQDSGLFNTTIAIPVNTVIAENKTYSIKRMVPGKILVAEIKGGEYRTNDAMRQLGIYMTDNHLSSPAIPFESLVTNRMEEPDTSKWVTKIYYPVF
jgi:effector-binding domain-containing protein